MRLIDADEFFKNYPELDIEPYNNAPTVDVFSEIDGLNNQIDDLSENLAWYINERNRLLKEQRPHGKWIKWNFETFGAFGDWEYKCSNCEKVYGGEYNYCPNCGAKMDGKEADNDRK